VADDDEHDEAPGGETPPELSERRFAENLRQAREDKGMSQVKLAQEMAARGWPWRQQTVTRVESGQRMVRLGEALAVAEILGTSVTMLTASTRETTAVYLLASSTSKVKQAFKEITRWTQTLLWNQGQLRTTLREAERHGYPESSLVTEVAAEAAEVVLLMPEQAVSEARADLEDLHESVAEHNEWASVVTNVIRAYIEEGMSIRAISQAEPVSERQVREILEEHGVAIRGRRRGDVPATPTVDSLEGPAADGDSAQRGGA
jgi:transcriptional regulator with XRE-family HTH domain